MEKLDEAIVKTMEIEMGITADKLKNDLDIIRKWVNQQPHLPNLEENKETDDWLYHFLFNAKNRIEKVKKTIEFYFSCKSLMPEFYENRNPELPNIKSSLKALYLVTLPKLTPEGCRVHVFCHAVPDPNAFEPNDFMRRALMMCDWKMKNDLTAGDIIIFHMKYSTLAIWARYNLVTLSKFTAAVINAYPFRIKAVHFTNAPSFVGHIISNPFITAKLKKRIKIHTGDNMTGLFENIPKDCLPNELGGTLNDTLEELNESTYKNILEMKDWFLENEKMKSDESQRPPHLKDNYLFGCDGTFRSLSLD